MYSVGYVHGCIIRIFHLQGAKYRDLLHLHLALGIVHQGIGWMIDQPTILCICTEPVLCGSCVSAFEYMYVNSCC